MKIMSVNAGSSSIKFQLLNMPSEDVIASGIVEKIGFEECIFTIKYNDKKETINPKIENHSDGVKLILKNLIDKKILKNYDEIEGVGHRVVQGGEYFKSSVIIDEKVEKLIDELSDLAPLHNPANLIGIRAFKQLLPKTIQVAVFDTVFHQTMEKEVYLYALPYEYYTDYKIRKYGAHGTSHQYVSLRCAELLKKDIKDTKIIVCHLGNGASICAVNGGKSVDTTMGLTPLEGIPMGTRSGNIDPTIVSYLQEKLDLSSEEVINILNKKSGYLGLSGVSSDARDVTDLMNKGNERGKLTFDIQSKRIVDYIASYYVLMNGCDAICFTAGLGENVIHLRQNILNRLSVLGVKIDKTKNSIQGKEGIITSDDSKIKAFVIPTNEEVMIARDVMRLKGIK